MVLRLSDVEQNIKEMDTSYDANFGEWIRNEENARIVGYHLHKYIDFYSTSEIIIVTKWIVKDWTLRSIILLIKKMLIDELILNSFNMDFKYEKMKEKDYHMKFLRAINIVQGVIYTWNPLFMAEFLVSISKSFILSDKEKFLIKIFEGLESNKSKEIITYLDEKIEKEILEKLKKIKHKPLKSKKLLNAFNSSK